MDVLEPLAPKFGDTPSIPIGCNRLQSVATDREVWCGNGIIFCCIRKGSLEMGETTKGQGSETALYKQARSTNLVI